MTTDDAARLCRRAEALRSALEALTADELGDDMVVAAVAVAPGFRLDGPGATPADALGAHRDARRAAMAAVLAAVVPTVRQDAASLAAELTTVRLDLVHPMTDEPLSLLDWVNRGGDPGRAVAQASRIPQR